MITASRGPQVILEGLARAAARGGLGRTMRENVAAMDLLVGSGLVADGNTVDGTSRTGAKAYDAVIAQFPHEPLHAWEVPAPLLQWPDGFGQPMADSGAVGDGVTDDQPVIQVFLDQIAAQGGGQVLLPPNTWYAINAAPLTIPANVWVKGSYNVFGNNTGGYFFSGGGFLVNPALSSGIRMSGPSSLTNCKIFRQGLVENAPADLVNTHVAGWAAEVTRLVTTAATTNSTTLTFASVSGVTPGMPVVAATSVTGTVTVVSSDATTVTLSAPVTIAEGATVRFGGSVGLMAPQGQAGIVLDHVKIIGFNSGIITATGQHFYSNIEADNIYNAEWINAGDGCYARALHFVPYYGQSQTLIPPRPGDSVFVHDSVVGLHIHGMQSYGWQNGVHMKNCAGPAMLFDIICETQGPLTPGLGCKGFWLDDCHSTHLHGCFAAGQDIGFHLVDCTILELTGCFAAGGPIGAGTAHYKIENPTISGRMGLLNCSSYAAQATQASFIFGPGISYCRFVPGYIIAPSLDPCIIIDPSVANAIERIGTSDSNRFGQSVIQSYMREKLYIEGEGGATTDGSPTATLTVKIQDSDTTQKQLIALLRNNVQAASLEITSNSLYIIPTIGLFLGAPNRLTTIQGPTDFGQWFSQGNTFVLQPASGDTISWATGVPANIITGLGTIAALTINLPTVAVSPDRLNIKLIFSVAVTALTIATTDGAVIKPTITTALAGTAISFVLNANTTSWHAYV